MSALQRLAREAGLQVRWEDAAGRAQEVSERSLVKVLSALGLPASTGPEIAASRQHLENLREEAAARFITARVGDIIALPSTLEGRATLCLESGESREIDLSSGQLEGLDEPGYHRLLHGRGETVIALAPTRCFALSDIAPGLRPWGVSVQVPSLRCEDDKPFGDLGTLAATATALAERGADLLAISPVHALFPADPARFSPYGPSSRRFLNVVLADPSLAEAGPDEGDTGESGSGELIDWTEAIPRRLERLRRAFDAMDEERRARLVRSAHLSEADLAAHALHDALHAHFAAEGRFGWREWPEQYRRPASEAVAAFAAENEREIAFYAWLQGLAETGLAAAHRAAQEAGMAIGLVTDLAVGIDPSGADCWDSPDAYLEGLSVGAPPDLLGPEGQDWGLTTFNPLTLHKTRFRALRETLSAAMAHAGGVRIDHVLGLRRVWVVPHGAPSSEGCYLAMPQREFADILALESWRHGCIVIGEDLGTVPDGLREEMAASNILGMRVLWFERDEDGRFTDPAGWDRKAVAMTTTHDLPTLAGWWLGRDREWARRIGRKIPADEERTAERSRIWECLGAGGEPPEDAAPFVTAAIAHVAGSACDMALVPLEDIAGLEEQPNLPGTIDQHPNWRRRLPESTGAMLTRPEVAERIAALEKGRTA